MANNWREAVTDLLPGHWKRKYGERLTGYIALLQDGISAGMTEAIAAPWLAEDTSPDDVLQLKASERRMRRYPGETAAAHRARLLGAWEAWKFAGNESAIVSQLTLFGLTDIEIFTAREWDWDGSAPGLGTWREGVGGSDNWSRFWVVIHGHPWATRTWSDPILPGHVLGLNATAEEIRAVRSIVQQWKSAEALNPWIVIVTDPAEWAISGTPNGIWYDWRQRSSGARYMDGKGQRPVILT